VAVQRYSYKHETLNEERKQKLEALGFEWVVGTSQGENRQITNDKKWDNMLTDLKAYKKEHNHCNVPYKVVKLGHGRTHNGKHTKMKRLRMRENDSSNN